MEKGGPSEKDKRLNGAVHPDLDEEFDDDDDMMDAPSVKDFDEATLKLFTKKAATSFFKHYGLISHQINSYNDFIKEGIQNVFDSIGEIIVEPGYDPSKKGDNEWRFASVKFGKVTLERPRFWTGEKFSADSGKEYLEFLPRHARLQNMTYSSRMKVQFTKEVYTQELVRSDKFKTGKDKYLDKKVIETESGDVIIGRIPVMVNSDSCWMSGADKNDCDYDQGGYFIIKGAEKTFIAQEQLGSNRVWLSDNQSWRVTYRSVNKRKRVYVKLADGPKFEDIGSSAKLVTVYILSLMDIPIWILFYALGVKSDKEVINLIDADIKDVNITNILVASIHAADQECEDFRKGKNSLKFIENLLKKSRFPPKESVVESIEAYLFPSIVGFGRKARFLGYMVKCLLDGYTGQRKPDNKDDFRNKRLELAGELLERELKNHLRHAERQMVKSMQRDLYPDKTVREIVCYLDAAIITNGLSRAFSTGSWSHAYQNMEKTSGVVAMLRRANPLQMIADMRRTRQRVLYAGKAGDARYPHPSHWGKICYLSTPDGEDCGLIKNLAGTALVTTTVREQISDTLVACGMEKLVDDTKTSVNEMDKIFVDGDWVGICENSASFVAEFRRRRRRKEVPHQVEIKRDGKHKEVRIFCDAGRVLRPLLVVKNLHKIKLLKGGGHSFQDLLDNGVVELIGPEEEEDCCTAWDIKYLFLEEKNHYPAKYTHCELDMSFMLGLSCGIIPFANHDHAKRVLYQSQKHSQQAIGYSCTNPDIRVDTLSHQLFYTQRPLFKTVLSDCLEKSGQPSGQSQKGMIPRPEFYNGQCAIVAVNVHLGYNQEDSLVMNRSSLDRGMFRSEHIRSYKAEVENKEAASGKKISNDDTVNFGKIQSKIGRVDSLDDDGFPFIGANLQSGDIVIGKYTESGSDHSVKLKHTERGMVQKVILSANDEGKNFAVVSLRQVRSPCLGDKFSSMHGQKGVLGYLETQENFPFSVQGIVPDIVINPHAFPSRQTPGQMLESALGKGIALGGSQRYATPFSSPSVDAITNQLHRAGFSRWGSERLYDGRTGEIIKSLVFMGPTFYQRLVHMSEDKVKFRNTGPVHPLTRQPVADRKRFGGIKFGYMERDCLIAHGASANLHERLFTLSDSSEMHVCTRCKRMATVIQRTVPGGLKIRGPYCRVCDSLEDVIKVRVPYGAKLLSQELFCMGISLKFDTELC
ncbi:DNA-directed RNA polymerases IV and V subunit 2-like [Rutidosis leptorrhynchoides]|uniref:DNA-directed RNA polymerases IV and V subunit 2-like n=1 Tax=Rutidosis leptorrhynchoides TaxID=125765 RepID=UPI003A995DFD